MKTAVLWFKLLFKFLNKRRLFFSRKIKLKLTDRPQRINYILKDPIQSIILITTSEHFGDSAYILGLACSLAKRNIHVTIASLPCMENFFKSVDLIDVYILEKHTFNSKKFPLNFDAAVDLEYLNCSFWNYRQPLLKKLRCYSVTTSEICADLNLFNKYISYRSVPHVSERLALVYSFITKDKSANKIFPYFPCSESDLTWASNFISFFKNKKIFYFNTVAGDDDRCFSKSQILSMIASFNTIKDAIIILNSNVTHNSKLPNNVVVLPKISFNKLTALIKLCKAVITPDTSITHIASFYNIPTFVVFPPNDRDFFHEYSAAQAWGALSECSVTLTPDDADLIIDPFGFGYPNRKARALATVDCTYLCNQLRIFLKNINELNKNGKI